MICNPPHCLQFDHGPTKKPHHSASSSSSIPEVHITIQNITYDTTASTSHTNNISYQTTPSPPLPSQPRNPTHSNTPEESTDTYPPIKSVLELIEADRPGKGFAKLKGYWKRQVWFHLATW